MLVSMSANPSLVNDSTVLLGKNGNLSADVLLLHLRLDANQNGRLERSDFKNYDAHDKLWQDILEVHDFDGDGAVTEVGGAVYHCSLLPHLEHERN